MMLLLLFIAFSTGAALSPRWCRCLGVLAAAQRGVAIRDVEACDVTRRRHITRTKAELLSHVVSANNSILNKYAFTLSVVNSLRSDYIRVHVCQYILCRIQCIESETVRV